MELQSKKESNNMARDPIGDHFFGEVSRQKVRKVFGIFYDFQFAFTCIDNFFRLVITLLILRVYFSVRQNRGLAYVLRTEQG